MPANLRTLARCVLCCALAGAVARAEIAVVSSSSASLEGRIAWFSEAQSGDVAPERTARLLSTMNDVRYCALDPLAGEFFASHGFGDNPHGVGVWSESASGDAIPPLRDLGGGVSQIQSPQGVAVDPIHDEQLVVTFDSFVAAYSRTQDGGAFQPLRTLSLPTLNGQWRGLFLDLDRDELYVAFSSFDATPGAVYVYERTATGLATPLRVLAGAATMLSQPQGIFVDLEHDELVVAEAAGPAVSVFARDADGDVAPLRRLAGATTLIDFPRGVVVTRDDELLVTNQHQTDPAGYGLLVFPRLADADQAPARTVTGIAAAFPLLEASQIVGVTSTRATACASGFAGSTHWIFFDGFETGGTSDWSLVAP